MDKKEVLTIHVQVTKAQEVRGTTGEALMLHFCGHCHSDLFQGEIIPGGIDTQKEWYGEQRTLSARYILEGVDFTGEACNIFIENNASLDRSGNIVTTPKVLTNSDALSFLERVELMGTIEGVEGGVCIHIYTLN